MRIDSQNFRVKFIKGIAAWHLIVVSLFASTLGCSRSTDTGVKETVQQKSDVADQSSAWLTDLPAAIRKSVETDKPLMVVSILGDMGERC